MEKNRVDVENLNRYKEEFLSGDEMAFSQIYRLLSKDLYAYGLSFYAHHELIEDAIHDVFMNIYANKKLLLKVDNMRNYLFRVFRNHLFFLIKKESLHLSMEEHIYPEYMEGNFEERWIDQETEDEKRVLANKLLIGLNVHQREVIYLRYMEGLSCEEVSNIMKIDIQSVKNLTYRAMKKIKAILICVMLLFIC